MTEENLYNDRITKNLSIVAISDKYGVSQKTVKTRLKEYKIRKIKEKHPKPDEAEFRKMVAENSVSKIIKHYGIHEPTLYAWMKYFGIETPKSQQAQKEADARAEVIKNMVPIKVGDRVRLFADMMDIQGSFKPHTREATVFKKHRDHIVFQLANYKISVQNVDIRIGLARLEII